MSPADSLQGLRVLVTRPAGQADRLHDLIAAAGGRPVRLPAIEIHDTPDMEALQQAGVEYKVDEASGMLLVPSSKLKEIRMQLAGQGLPNSVGMGFELMQQDTGFGTSQMVEKARYQHAMQGELARTITTIGAVQSARVHLAIPKQSVFVRKRQPPSASVALRLHNGRALEDDQVQLLHMVGYG